MASRYFEANHLDKAYIFFEKSAKQGNANAQRMLGRCYEEGWGTNVDKTKAKFWFEKSATQGNEDAEKRLNIIQTAESDLEKVQENQPQFLFGRNKIFNLQEKPSNNFKRDNKTWNNYSVSKLEEAIGFESEFPKLVNDGLKRFKAADFLGATKKYLSAYKYLMDNKKFYENIHSEQPLYLSHNVFEIYRNCCLMRLSQITMFLNEKKLNRYLPIAAASECIEMDEEKFRNTLTIYSSQTPEKYFNAFYEDACFELKKLYDNINNLKQYICENNPHLAAGPRFAGLKREMKYQMSGIH